MIINMWRILIGVILAVLFFCIFFLWSRFCKFRIVKKLSGNRRWLRILIGLIPMAAFGLYAWLDTVNAVVVMLFLSLYFIVAEFIGFLVRLICKKSKKSVLSEESGRKDDRPYWVGIIVICFAFLYFSMGWYLAHNVWRTDYSISTEKDMGNVPLKIAFFADSHIGALFDGQGLSRHLDTIETTEPDILLITGDFIDDATTKEDLIASCKALSEFDCPYGKYFAFGNHDTGNYGFRHFTRDDLVNELTKAGVVILEDEAVLLDDRFYIIGRKDKSSPDRLPLKNIIEGLDKSKYMIVMDHQPNDYKAEAETGVDLVLSGHTHGGQMLEIKLITYLLKADDKIYGMEQRDNTVFIVTSGIADWALKFKTGTKSEFAIVSVFEQ